MSYTSVNNNRIVHSQPINVNSSVAESNELSSNDSPMSQDSPPIKTIFAEAIKEQKIHSGKIEKKSRKIKSKPSNEKKNADISHLGNNTISKHIFTYEVCYHACLQGDLKKIRNLLECYPEMIKCHAFDEEHVIEAPTLFYASVEFPDIMKLLYEKNPDALNILRGDHQTLMHIAAEKNCSLETIQWLHSKNPLFIKAKCRNGLTPMHTAAQKGALSIVRCLYRLEPSLIDERDNDFFTPLHHAAFHEKTFLLKFLCDAKKKEISLKKEKEKVDEYFEYLVHGIAIKNCTSSLKTLIDYGFNPNIERPESHPEEGQTPLHISAKSGAYRNVKFLLDFTKININASDAEGRTPIFFAVEHGHFEIVKLLIEKGANPICKNKKNVTLLHLAASIGSEKILKELLKIMKCRKLINDKDSFGNTPLHKACSGIEPGIVKLFIGQEFIEINPKNNHGDTPFHMAVKKGHIENALILLDSQRLEDTPNNNNVFAFDLIIGDNTDELLDIILEIPQEKKLKIFDLENVNYYKCFLEANLFEEQILFLLKSGLQNIGIKNFTRAARRLSAALRLLRQTKECCKALEKYISKKLEITQKRRLSFFSKEKIHISPFAISKKNSHHENSGMKILGATLMEFSSDPFISIFNVKLDLYQPFIKFLMAFYLTFNKKCKNPFEANPFEMIEALGFCEKGSKNLKNTLELILSLQGEFYQFNCEDFKELHQIYKVLIPFYRAASKFYLTQEKSVFIDNHFMEDNDYIKSFTYEKIMQYDKVLEIHEKSLSSCNSLHFDADQNSIDMLIQSARIEYNLRNFDKLDQLLGEIQCKIVPSLLRKIDISNDIAEKKYHNYRLANFYYERGLLFLNINKFPFAKDSLISALEIFEKLDYQPEISKCHFNLSVAYSNLDDHGVSTNELEKAMNIQLNFLEESSPILGLTYCKMGNLQKKIEINKAHNFVQDALKIQLKNFGENHPYVVECYSTLAEICIIQGGPVTALDYLQRAYTICEQVLEPGSSLELKIYELKGQAYEKLKNYDEAISFYEEAIYYTKEFFKNDIARIGKLNDMLSSIYDKKGEIHHQQALIDQIEEIATLDEEYVADIDDMIKTHFGV